MFCKNCGCMTVEQNEYCRYCESLFYGGEMGIIDDYPKQSEYRAVQNRSNAKNPVDKYFYDKFIERHTKTEKKRY